MAAPLPLGDCGQLDVGECDADGLIAACREQAIDLVVIGPEAPLAAGVADRLRDAGLAVFGPSAAGAQLEASKAWAKALMQEAGIPTAGHWAVADADEGLAVLERIQRPLVVKADGLAAGKGVTVAESIEESATAIREAFAGRFGAAGERVVLEERLQGPEVSVFALCDGERMVLLLPPRTTNDCWKGIAARTPVAWVPMPPPRCWTLPDWSRCVHWCSSPRSRLCKPREFNTGA